MTEHGSDGAAPDAAQPAEFGAGAPSDGTNADPSPPSQDDGPSPGEDGDRLQSAAELGSDASSRRRLRQAGLERLDGAWFEAATHFAGPASFGSGHAIGGNLSAAGRDVYNFIGAGVAEPTGVDSGPFTSALLDRIRATHVAGTGYRAAKQAVSSTRIAILRGVNGSGKRTTGLRLLAELTGNKVHELDVGTVLNPPPHNASLQDGAGYLAAGSAGSVFTYHRLAAWAAMLSQKNAYLIITAPAEVTVEADAAEHFLVDHTPPPRPAVVLSHLRADLVHGGAAEQLLERTALLSCASSLSAAAALAQYLLNEVRGAVPSVSVASFQHSLHVSEAHRMLSGNRLTEQRDRIDLLCRRAAMISIAVFDGLPYADAMTAAESLASAFIAIEFPRSADVGRELFIRWPDIFRAEPGISVVQEELRNRWGTALERQIRFSDPHLHGVLLEEVWERFDIVRSPLLDWLKDLAVRGPDEAVRVRAAQVVGRFAIRDFSHVCHRVVAEWANSVNQQHRQAAAAALEAAAAGQQAHVAELVREWCDAGSQHRQRTAILALGTTIGEHDPEATLKHLRRLILRDSAGAKRAVAESVRHSVIDLLSGPHQELVIRTLRRWALEEDTRLSSVARRCVPSLAHVTDDDGIPSFLTLLSGKAALTADAAHLFAAALSDPATRPETWDALERLSCAAAREVQHLRAVGGLLHELCQQPEINRDEVTFYVLLWAQRSADLPATPGATYVNLPTLVES